MEGNGRRKERGRVDDISVDIESSIHDHLKKQPPMQNKKFSSLANSIKEKVKALRPLHPECCIYRVPSKLRAKFEDVYMPRVVAIGPYHRTKPSLRGMEEHKLRYLHTFFRFNGTTRSLEDYIEAIKGWEEKCRRCYYEEINLGSDEFTEMMLVDGIFIIQLLLLNRNKHWVEENDRILNKPWLLTDVRRDMRLLENQIPFFLIQGLFDMAFGSTHPNHPTLMVLAYKFFRVANIPLETTTTTPRHFLDAIRLSHLPTRRNVDSSEVGGLVLFIPSVTELVASGIKLRIRSDSKCLLDIKFEYGVLEIPKLSLFPNTVSVLRNMVAFEQCYYKDDSYLIDYMTFLDHLVNTADDAKLLTRSGIIESWLGSDQAVADQINSYSGTSMWSKNAYFFHLRSDLVAYCNKPWNSWKASFVRNYLSSPWALISVGAALVLLLLTITQTVTSLIGL